MVRIQVNVYKHVELRNVVLRMCNVLLFIGRLHVLYNSVIVMQ